MGLKDLVQQMTGKRRTNLARNTATRNDPNTAQPAASGNMTVLTAKDLEGVQGGAFDYYLKTNFNKTGNIDTSRKNP